MKTKKRSKKGIVAPPKTITVEIDPRELAKCLTVPAVRYQVTALVDETVPFRGDVVPIPRALLYYLSGREMKVFAAIMEDTFNGGMCQLDIKTLSVKSGMNRGAVSNALYNLRAMGLLLESTGAGRGNGRYRAVNYEALQHLGDLLDGEEGGLIARLRSVCRKRDVAGMTREDVEKAYTATILPPGHDVEEEEEYD